MAQRSKGNFKSTKNSRYADSSTITILESTHRDMFEDVADTFAFLAETGLIANLTTADKTNLVAAINELVAKFKPYNFTATADPGVTNDINDTGASNGVGYEVGSKWLNTTTKEWFMCTDPADGAAVWEKLSLTQDELAAVALTGDANDLINYTASDILSKLLTVDGANSGLTSDIVSSGIITDLNAAWQTDINNALKIFKYAGDALNKPATADNANWVMNVYGNVKNYGHQISAVNSENIYFRHVNNGVFGAWLNLWHSGNDSNFAKLDAADNLFTGNQIVDPGGDFNKTFIVNRTQTDGLHQISMGISSVPYLLGKLNGVIKASLNFKLDGTFTDVKGKRLLNTDDLAKVYSTEQTITDGLTVTFDVSKGVNAKVTLGGNRTLAFSNVIAGQTLVLKVIQDATGSRTLALPANCKVMNGGGGAVTLTAAASAVDILTFYYDGTNFWVTYGKNFT
jgi:hypothetical protein